VTAEAESRMLPLYEATMIRHDDHRWATDEPDGRIRDVTQAQKYDASFVVMPRYWIAEDEVESRLAGRWDHPWLLGFRDICRSTDERTMINASIPRSAVNHKLPLVLAEANAGVLTALMSSMIFDYVARQKIGGTSMTYLLPQCAGSGTPTSMSWSTRWTSRQRRTTC